MPTYVSLLRYTQQGIMDAKNGPARLDAAKEGFRRAGAELKGFYLTMGQYDGLAILGAPDDVTAARLALGIATQGNFAWKRSGRTPKPSTARSLRRCPRTVGPAADPRYY